MLHVLQKITLVVYEKLGFYLVIFNRNDQKSDYQYLFDKC